MRTLRPDDGDEPRVFGGEVAFDLVEQIDDPDQASLQFQGNRKDRLDRQILGVGAGEALVGGEIVDQQRTTVLVHPPGQLYAETHRQSALAGGHDANKCLGRVAIRLPEKVNTPLLHAQPLNALAHNQLVDPLRGHRRVQSERDFVQDGKLFDGTVQPLIFLRQAL